MASGSRRPALAAIVATRPVKAKVDFRETSITELFGSNVFNDRVMRERLPASCYVALRESVETGKELLPEHANLVAAAMMQWAVERGATHFTHWFQPMTGLTAEKHDTFMHLVEDRLILEFSGKELIKGEPDASSFPSGGLRATFEARGYTAWDPTSPAFIVEGTTGSTLFIPTAFCSWNGEALDKKTPLLRSNEALNREAIRLLRVLGDEKTSNVYATLGCEQEYFLIDRNLFIARPDLVSTGRTVIGARPPKGQELEDHYFGSISPRVLAFMEDAELELWKLGIPIKTRHNEVAPSQFEVAHIYERSTIATDHNMLTMDVLRKVATRHGLVCLLHEKPFAGINGSGKHNNWSLATDGGANLFEPGTTPAANARFLVFLSAVLRAVDVHGDLLRVAIAHAGNDHRLGANEAPPAIISVFVGNELDDVVRGLMSGSGPSGDHRATSMRLGVSSLPPLPKDSTDRNRTSPFAFTGNKWEFRAVGASQSVASPNIMLNAIVAESLRYLADEIEKARASKNNLEAAIHSVVQTTLQQHYRIVFNGDNYAGEWHREAERRGLPNHANTVDALGSYAKEENIGLFESLGIYSRKEVVARSKIAYEQYAKAISIEAQACLGLASTSVLPAALDQQHRLAQSISETRRVLGEVDLGAQEDLLRRMATMTNGLIRAIESLQQAADHADKHTGGLEEHARDYRDRVVPAMDATRRSCDALETLVDDDLWKLPKYRELLFLH